ncbi:MAG TPA: histidine kinase [Candidatus Pelethocola excrementipullorum]|nr:histidine kinase [Candidatus Pelethocola excrementipullorum]
MFHKFTDRIRNAPLSKKFLILLLPGIFLLSFFIFIGFLLIIRSSNHILYQTTGELLSYSSRDISGDLNSIQDMADFILEDSLIQTALSNTKDSKDGGTPSNAYSAIQNVLNAHYQRYKSNYVDYIQVLNNNFSVLAAGIDSHVMPPELQEELIETARKQDGRLCWITDYSDTYGIFLVRSLRRIDNLKLDELGVLIINVNINQMLEDISITQSNNNAISYILCDGNQTLYVPNELKTFHKSDLTEVTTTSYEIKNIAGKQYFMVKGTIPATDWDYFCLSPYDSMYNNIRFFQKLFIIILIASLCLCILLTKLLMRPLMVHFETLMRKIKAFGNHNFELISIPYPYDKRYDEIGLLHQQFDSMAHKIQTLIKENYETKLLAKESQLRALEMQINPHFLYNTLQSIDWRAKMLKDLQISSMTESLGKLLRITLSRKNKHSYLGQELELVRHYMNIQEIRFEDSLSYEVEVSEELLGVYLPKFTLQPLVENAIHYTLEEDSDECLIRIHATVEDSAITITVANTESSFEENLLEKLLSKKILPQGFGIGILNVNKRLELAFGSSYCLDFFNKDHFATAKITIPYKLEGRYNDTTIDC